MAKVRKISDKWANVAYGEVVESAANTLTFSEIPTNVSIFEKAAWIISRLEWYLSAAMYNMLDADGLGINMALTATSQLNALTLDSPGVVDLMEIHQDFIGAPTKATYHFAPVTRDFSTMPGGGRIVAPRPLYVATQGVGLAAVTTIECRVFFQQIILQPDEYIELIDFYRIVS